MATVPCTLLVRSNDPVNIPADTMLILCRQFFKYGVKSMTLRNDQVLIQLIYTLKGETIKKKIGPLPISCLILALESEEELEKLEDVMKKYQFNLMETGDEEVLMLEQPPQPGSSKLPTKRRLPEKVAPSSTTKKIRVLENRMVAPKHSPEEEDHDILTLIEDFDDDADLFNSQKYTLKMVNEKKKNPIDIVKEGGRSPLNKPSSTSFINID